MKKNKKKINMKSKHDPGSVSTSEIRVTLMENV